MYGRISGQPSDDVPAWGSTDPTWRPGPRKGRSLARMVGIAVGSSAIVACGAITALFALRHAHHGPSLDGPAPTAVVSWEGQPAPAGASPGAPGAAGAAGAVGTAPAASTTPAPRRPSVKFAAPPGPPARPPPRMKHPDPRDAQHARQ